MMIGARQLAQHEAVKPIRLPTRDAEPIAGRRRPIDAGAIFRLHCNLFLVRTTRQCPDREVPLRTLIDRPSAEVGPLPTAVEATTQLRMTYERKS